MVAAAGFGKTYVISAAVAEHGRGRELILTHTHAGVDAIRRRLQSFGVPATAYHVDTLAGWALRFSAAYPATSQLQSTTPRSDAEYIGTYQAAQRLLNHRNLQAVVKASYTGLYVDEYQDCTVEQHSLVLALAELLPCRVVGDPLQGIYAFGRNRLVSWPEHIEPVFEEIAGPVTPWRWKEANSALGEWLQCARQQLLDGAPLTLDHAPVTWIKKASGRDGISRQRGACFRMAKDSEASVIAIHDFAARGHKIARGLKGIYSCVEPIDSPDLYSFAGRIDGSNGFQRAEAVLDFATSCMTTVSTELAGARRALQVGRMPGGAKHSSQKRALSDLVSSHEYLPISSALQALIKIPGVSVFRKELLRAMISAVRTVALGEAPTLSDAVALVRGRTRHAGRRLARCSVGTTLLVKGLEFDHAIVLDGDALTARNLYVAITRGSRSLTVVSGTKEIRPRKD